MRSFLFLAGLPVLAAASPLKRRDNSTVTSVALPNVCSSYPQYDETSGIAGPWVIVADSTGDPEMDGHTSTTSVATGYQPIYWGSIVIQADMSLPHTLIRCSGDRLEALVHDYTSICLPYCTGPPRDPTVDKPLNWRPLAIGVTQGLNFQSLTGASPKPFAHYVDGVRQPGVFLGANMEDSQFSTQWLFAPSTNTRNESTFYPSKIYAPASEGSTVGFLKISEETAAE